jgi:hypothetical protein
LFAMSLAATSVHGLPVYEDLGTTRAIATGPMPRPGYLESTIDPAFRTPFVRVNDPDTPVAAGVSCGSAYCRHRYSRWQGLDADRGLFLIANGCHGFCFLDGRSYKPLFRRSVSNECEWHPANPALMICVKGNEIYTWAPSNDTKTTIYVADTYKNLQLGPYKGNPSKDGDRLVVRAMDDQGTLVAFAYDIFVRIKYAYIKLLN